MPTTVILGAGIIGLSSAHQLALLAPPEHRIHLVEPSPRLFASASGNAAGFLAKDWFAPAIAPLGVLSFDLHRTLADAHNGRARWGYSESISFSLDHNDQSDNNSSESLPPQPCVAAFAVDAIGKASDLGPATDAADADASDDEPKDWLLTGVSRATTAADPEENTAATSEGSSASHVPRWLRARPEALEVLSDRRSTAQVHPRRLCEFLLEQCLAAGVILHHPARATSLLRDEKDPDGLTRIRVEYQGQEPDSPDRSDRVVDIPCENIVIAAGCWTPQVYTTLFPNASRIPRVSHLAGYSLTLKSKHWPTVPVPSALDTPEDATVSSSSPPPPASSVDSSPCHAIFTDAGGFAAEIFSRTTGDVWLGGLNPSTETLPALPTDAQMDAAQVERLLAVARTLCGEDVEVRGEALCFRPVSATGRPIIARMHEADLGDGLKPTGLNGAGGVFVATAHGPWGISLSLGTGRVVAELVLGRETSADVQALARWDGVFDYSTRPMTP